MDMQKIGGFLKELRKENNLTQDELGERITAQNVKSVSQKSSAVTLKHRKIINWVVAVLVALLYVYVSLVSQKWQYTWLIWLIYCIYRIAESVILNLFDNHAKSKKSS